MRCQDATGAGSRRAEEAKPLIVRRRGRLSNLRLRDDDEKDDDNETKSSSPKTASPTSTKSPPSSPTTTSSSSSTRSSALTSTTSTTLASTTPPPPASTLPPPPPLPPPQTFGKSPPEQTTPAPVATSIPQAAPAVTPTPQAITQAPTTLSSLTMPSSSDSVPVVAINPDQAQTQNAGSQSQVGSPNNSASIVAAILGKRKPDHGLNVVIVAPIALILAVDADKGPFSNLGCRSLLGVLRMEVRQPPPKATARKRGSDKNRNLQLLRI